MSPEDLIRAALDEAKAAALEGEVPVGAVIEVDGKILSRAHNKRERTADPTAHAELLAIREAAARLGSWRMEKATLAVTMEPCPMCAGAIVNARIARLIYGCSDPKAGSVFSLYNIVQDPRLNHEVEVVDGVLVDECKALLEEFFETKRGRDEK
jgi:tRNA(adenine34) deaminase